MRRRRRVLRVSLVTVLGILGTLIGTFVAVFFTPAGKGLAGRALSERVDQLLRGDVQVGAVGGTLLTGLNLDQLVIRDTSGALLADIPRMEVRYRLPELLAGRIVVQRLTLERPRFHIIKHRDGRMNYEEVLRLGESHGNGPGTLVRFQDVDIRDGSLQLDLPWSPPDSMRTPDRARQALLTDRRRPGRVIEAGPEGYTRRVSFTHLTARFPMMRLGTPDHKPVLLVVDTLATRVSDPGTTITQLNGTVEIDGTTLTFRVKRAALPHSRFAGNGQLSWPRGPVRYDFTLAAEALDLTDLRWISPFFPALAGHARITARSTGDARTDYRLDGLALAGRQGRVDGAVTVVMDETRGLGIDRMALTLDQLDLDVPRPYLDSLPLHGTLSGPVRGGGFLDSLDLDFDWRFADAQVAGRPVSRLSALGHLAFGGPHGTRFDTLTVREADLDLGTVRSLAPAVPLRGRLAAQGRVTGYWDDLTFDGTAVQQEGAAPPSTITGTLRLDTRTPVTGYAADVTLAPLALDGIAPQVRPLARVGPVRGHVTLAGTSAWTAITADLTGAAGTVGVRGAAGVIGGRWRADSLTVSFRDLDTRGLAGRGPVTALTGSAFLDGTFDPAAGPEGIGRVALTTGRAGEFDFDTVAIALRGGGGTVRVDTVGIGWPGGDAGGSGELGWHVPSGRGLLLTATARDLRPLDPLLVALTGVTHDSASHPLAGKATLTATVGGDVDSLAVSAEGRITDLLFGSVSLPTAGVALGWNGGPRPTVSARVSVDTANISGLGVADGVAALTGFADSLSWSLASRVGGNDSLRGGGSWMRGSGSGSRFVLDSLRGALTAHTWTLERPAALLLADSGIGIDSLALATTDGVGRVIVSGTAPGLVPGALRVRALGVDLRDVTGIFGTDSTGLSGLANADLDVGGTAARPTLRGSASLEDVGVGAFRGPYARVAASYADRRLDLGLDLWRTGRKVLTGEAHLPVDLALRDVPRRLVEGPLDIHLQGDSADLAMFSAFTRNARDITGAFAVDAGIEGTWDDPRLNGTVAMRDGGVSLPGLGVRYDRINGGATLQGDSIVLQGLSLRGGAGSLAVGGSIRLEKLTRPILDLDLTAQGFRAMDVRNYLTLVASGRLKLKGPFFGATLSGRGTADQGVLYFADLVTKQVVDLGDPAVMALLDTSQVHDARLGPSLQNRFLDSLAIDHLQVGVGDEFWLRSTEANIRLTGAMTVTKAARAYRLDGTLKADRGTYALKVGFITRPFTVQSGTVRFLGTPDLNAELDIQAVHTVRPADASADIPVVAHITGTTLAPKLALSSPQDPTLSETELVSYLMFGRPSFALDQTQGSATVGGEQAALQAGISYLSSALSTEIERALVSDLGVPVDFVEIRPGGAGGSFVNPNAGLTTLSAGWRIGKRTFFTFNAGLCPNLGQLGYKSFGASIEQRFNPWVRAQASVEPVQNCQPNVAVDALNATNQYQLGLDLLWEREY